MKRICDTGTELSVAALDQHWIAEAHFSENTGWLWWQTGVIQQEDIKWTAASRINMEVGSMPNLISLDPYTLLLVYCNSKGAFGFNKAEYRFGTLSDGKLAWKGSHGYDYARHPSFCKINNETVLEVHQSHCRNALYYNIAKVNWSNLELQLSKSLEFEKAGTSPFVVALDRKVFLVLYENRGLICQRLGQLDGDKIVWGVRMEQFPGSHPKAVYMGDDKAVCFFCRDDKLYYCNGRVMQDFAVTWSYAKELARGKNISATRIPGTQKLVELHVADSVMVHYNSGCYFEEETKWHDNNVKLTEPWMTRIDDEKYLSEINIPGAHDCGTAYIKAEGRDYERYSCQCMSFEEQLKAGIRYFDIRCGVKEIDQKSVVVIKHDIIECLTATDDTNLTLETIFAYGEKFLNENPGESLIYEIKCEDIGGRSLRKVKEFLKDRITRFDTKIWRSESYSNIPTLKQVRGKMVLLCRWEKPEYAFGLSDWGNNTRWSKAGSCFFIQDVYLTGYENKRKYVEEAICKMQALDNSCMVLNYLSCTNPYPFTEAKQMNPWFLSYLECQTNRKRLGTVVLDFATPKLCEAIYSTNFK